MQAHIFKVSSVSLLFLPTLYFPRWSDRGSTDPSISGCLDSLPSVHHGADPRPPTRSLHLPGGRCRCCSPPRPGEGATGVCFSYLYFVFLVLSRIRAAPTIQGTFYRHTQLMPVPRYTSDYRAWILLHCTGVFSIFNLSFIATELILERGKM